MILLYRILLPFYLLVALPPWVAKMARRSGLGSGLGERAGVYRGPVEFEPCGAVHVHAVSVGEAMLALKLIRAWRAREPRADFVLALGTSTGLQVARESAPDGVRVVYQPIDLGIAVRRYLDRFEPSQLVLVEGEMWPNLMAACARRGIPVRLVNARMSPRSRRRYERFAAWVRPVFRRLDAVAVQDPADEAIWRRLGVGRVVTTGSLKFDSEGHAPPRQREEFGAMIEICCAGRPVVLAASTHAGEELAIGKAVRAAGGLLAVAPRHAERRDEVARELTAAGFEVIVRADLKLPRRAARCCLLIDSTGELRDWTAHADAVVIGKSFLGSGGQNPAEAIEARVPVVFGPHMENFEPLAGRLIEQGGAVRVEGIDELPQALRFALDSGELLTGPAAEVLAAHAGATKRMLDLLGAKVEGGRAEA